MHFIVGITTELSKFEYMHFKEIKLDTVTFCHKKTQTGEGKTAPTALH